MTTATIVRETPERRISRQSKRIRMARAAMDVSSLQEFAQLVSQEMGETVSAEKLRRIERGERDVEYALLRAIGTVVGDAISDETGTPLEWLAGGGDPVFVNPGYLNGRWRDLVIPNDRRLVALSEAS